ncbi:DNA-binding response regulator [Streptomyces dioscori]|uniref:DNA-binding response regulator n=1 Tax=Streptomyces dioscori TaxID=2109333 RepID=A0A2P8QGC7_9ACTN|nr:response regulator transcription factor [Streptomyces dioscori]PSM45304.1 DNA-binding response regulator [Streptomyces dioscori]
MTVRVVLADDQPLVRTALRLVIADEAGLEVVGEAGTGAEAVALAEKERPDVVVMDIRMPGMDGIEATRLITRGPDAGHVTRVDATHVTHVTHVIVLTTFDDDDCLYGALRAGAAGFLVKDMALEDILDAIRVVATGDGLLAPSVTRRLIRDFADRPASATPDAAPSARTVGGITGREREVLALVGAGLSNTEIAERLSISVATAKTYVSRLLTKLDARDRVRLVIIAYESGLVASGR